MPAPSLRQVEAAARQLVEGIPARSAGLCASGDAEVVPRRSYAGPNAVLSGIFLG